MKQHPMCMTEHELLLMDEFIELNHHLKDNISSI
jgi:hypothetical protein